MATEQGQFELKFWKKLAKERDSCVKKVKRALHLAIEPQNLRNIGAGIKERLNCNLKRYNAELKGILVGYKNLKLCASTGILISDHSYIHLDICSKFYLFIPVVGSHLKGVVNKKSHSHISCLVHKTFNASICKKKEVEKNHWKGFWLELGEEVEFVVTYIDLGGSMPYIRGELIEDTMEFPNSVKTEPVDELLDFEGSEGPFQKESGNGSMDSGISTLDSINQDMPNATRETKKGKKARKRKIHEISDEDTEDAVKLPKKRRKWTTNEVHNSDSEEVQTFTDNFKVTNSKMKKETKENLIKINDEMNDEIIVTPTTNDNISDIDDGNDITKRFSKKKNKQKSIRTRNEVYRKHEKQNISFSDSSSTVSSPRKKKQQKSVGIKASEDDRTCTSTLRISDDADGDRLQSVELNIVNTETNEDIEDHTGEQSVHNYKKMFGTFHSSDKKNEEHSKKKLKKMKKKEKSTSFCNESLVDSVFTEMGGDKGVDNKVSPKKSSSSSSQKKCKKKSDSIETPSATHNLYFLGETEARTAEAFSSDNPTHLEHISQSSENLCYIKNVDIKPHKKKVKQNETVHIKSSKASAFHEEEVTDKLSEIKKTLGGNVNDKNRDVVTSSESYGLWRR